MEEEIVSQLQNFGYEQNEIADARNFGLQRDRNDINKIIENIEEQRERQQNRLMNVNVNIDKYSKLPHVILMGTASSGKTTFLKQLDYLYNKGQNIATLSNHNIVKDIRQNCVDDIAALCDLLNYNRTDIKCINGY